MKINAVCSFCEMIRTASDKHIDIGIRKSAAIASIIVPVVFMGNKGSRRGMGDS